ncbi:hypothetical protein L0B53_18535 (plasmid) [Vibrio sp. SS-MA-C1-2]|uniref:hypothetical protein n=1 Tax=Vibrio sp. SS-MA-C1-2 TaxID=2908646 RepID=UPI001F3BF2D3|nr:hypothetical protein [Vibrio sp. SS-MA-C1-2]UJF20321.1 hypothetical protein L0B53_18535 [Vibrio sp. SS-MA-C1-2]
MAEFNYNQVLNKYNVTNITEAELDLLKYLDREKFSDTAIVKLIIDRRIAIHGCSESMQTKKSIYLNTSI